MPNLHVINFVKMFKIIKKFPKKFQQFSEKLSNNYKRNVLKIVKWIFDDIFPKR